MRSRSKISVVALIFFFFLAVCQVRLFSEEKPDIPKEIERLKRQIEGVIHGVEENIGVAVEHLESGEEFFVNGDVYFPMASVFKVPILVEVMALVNEGSLSLEDEVSLQKSDQHMGSGMLSDLDAPGITLSIRNLINLMMKISDNSATDVLLARVGAENVNARMRQYGIEKITVNRTCQHLIMDFLGMDPNDYRGFSSDQIHTDYRRIKEVNPETVEEAQKKFSTILKDQSTPGDMNRLLELIFQKKILNEESCDTIIDVMLECQTGEGRIKGDLPRGTKVAHKTGTLGGTVNDSGIIFLPDGLGHVAITVFTKDMEMDTGEVEEIIAQISRFVYDYFYFTSWSNT